MISSARPVAEGHAGLLPHESCHWYTRLIHLQSKHPWCARCQPAPNRGSMPHIGESPDRLSYEAEWVVERYRVGAVKRASSPPLLSNARDRSAAFAAPGTDTSHHIASSAAWAGALRHGRWLVRGAPTLAPASRRLHRGGGFSSGLCEKPPVQPALRGWRVSGQEHRQPGRPARCTGSDSKTAAPTGLRLCITSGQTSYERGMPITALFDSTRGRQKAWEPVQCRSGPSTTRP